MRKSLVNMPLRPYKLVYPKYTASQLSANFSFQTFVLDTVKLNRGHLRMLRKGRDAVRQWNMIVNGLFSKDKKKRKKLVNEVGRPSYHHGI